MTKIFLKLVLLIGLVFGLNRAVDGSMGLSATWGESDLGGKHATYRDQAEQYEILCIGSSRTHRHLVPQVLTQGLSELGDLHVYNLGIPGFAFPKTDYLYREVLGNKSPALRTVLFELDEIKLPNGVNVHTTENRYWSNWTDTQLFLSAIWRQELTTREKIEQSWSNLTTLGEHWFNAGMLTKQLEYRLSQDLKAEGDTSDNGYASLTSDLRAGGRPDLEKRQAVFASNPSQVSVRQGALKKIYKRRARRKRQGKPAPEADTLLLNRLEHLIGASEEAGVLLIFVLPPKSPSPNYEVLLPVFDALPERNRLDMANPNKFAQFYDPKYSFDKGHFNEKGAQLYSRIVAEQLKSHLQQHSAPSANQ